jgi:hypothetical protein
MYVARRYQHQQERFVNMSGEVRGWGGTDDSRVPTSISQIVDGRLHLGLCLLLLQESSELSLFLPNMKTRAIRHLVVIVTAEQ